jgi:hypothetical protein
VTKLGRILLTGSLAQNVNARKMLDIFVDGEENAIFNVFWNM